MKCDHTSVGVLVWKDSKLLLIERRKTPFGFAPPSGHLDGKSYEEAAKQEVLEEVGLNVVKLKFLHEERAEKACRRKGGNWHNWRIYEAKVTGTVKRSLVETKQVGWYDVKEIKKLASRTKDYRDGKISDGKWEAKPGIESVWYDWFRELQVI